VWCVRSDGALLLVLDRAGRWRLPGGPVAHGEYPGTSARRLAEAETGVALALGRLRSAEAEVDFGNPASHAVSHHDILIFDAVTANGEGGGTWSPLEDVAALELAPVVRRQLGLENAPERVDVGAAPAYHGPPPRPPRAQRFGAYGLVTDSDGRVLLSLIANGYPSAGRWHLPGGGTDLGEQPGDGLLREIFEETGQRGRITELLGVSHRHNPAAFGPEGYPIDWHTVRVMYSVTVDHPTEPVVTEAAGGSTAKAAWFVAGQLRGLPLTEVAQALVRRDEPPVTGRSRHRFDR
jgi:ADP-ribose pyrophosphatase YjhB (NUDIX family)